MVISGGENVYPAEIENVLHEHPAVKEAAVVGVPDERWGEACLAFVVLDGEATEEELLEHCRGRLARYKVPKGVPLRRVAAAERARQGRQVGAAGAGPMKQLTARGERTRQKLLESAERIFAELGYHDASIVKITEAAGVGQGTFYLYFSSKKEVFDEVVLDLNVRVRHAMTEAAAKGTTRAEQELLGFGAFFRFTADHPALYRIIRQAEFVSPETLVTHYDRLMRPYAAGLEQAMEAGEVAPGDAEVLAWSLMGIGELCGMRWILWNGEQGMPEQVFDELARIIVRALGAKDLDP